MQPESIFLTCFLVGFLLSLLSIFLTAVDIPMADHPGEVPDLSGDATDGSASGGSHSHHSFSAFNFTTVSAFLAWFGGAGYLLQRYATVGMFFAVGLAILSGLIGATIVFLIVTRVLLRNERDLDPADFDMVGVLGHVSSAVREGGGVGEMIYQLEDTRRSVAVRAEDGVSPIARDIEVVVTRYENGIAYVRRWDELSGMEE